MERTIKAILEYEVHLTDSEYGITFDRTSENELAACMVAREILKFSKENLLKSLDQAKGKHLKLVKDRLSKVTTTEYTLTLLIESIIEEFLIEEPCQENQEKSA